MKVDLGAVEEAAKELYIRALKVLPPDIKAGFTRLTASETTNALFVVELTEGAKTGMPPAGRATNETSVMLTMTSIAQVRPTLAAASNSCVASQGQQVMRAMITAEKAPGL